VAIRLIEKSMPTNSEAIPGQKPVSGPQALLAAAEHHWDRWVDTGRLPASETVQSRTQNLFDL
jgi:hypothetical protein